MLRRQLSSPIPTSGNVASAVRYSSLPRSMLKLTATDITTYADTSQRVKHAEKAGRRLTPEDLDAIAEGTAKYLVSPLGTNYKVKVWKAFGDLSSRGMDKLGTTMKAVWNTPADRTTRNAYMRMLRLRRGVNCLSGISQNDQDFICS